MEWRIKNFDWLTKRELYDILRMRSEVFVAEQCSPYNDVDGADLCALHLFAYDGETLAASMRVLQAGITYDTPSLGRVAVAPAYRGRGLARAMMERGISLARAEFGDCALTSGAQVYLTEFYRSFGFIEISEPYDDAGVQHVDMRLELRGAGRV